MAGRRAGAQALVAWLEINGGYVHPDVDLFAEIGNSELGVRALKPIAEGDQLLLVPKSLCIYVCELAGATTQALPDSPLLELVRGLKLSPFLSTVLLLMAGRAQGADCKYAAYINTLPARHECLLSWTEEERADLQGTDLEDRRETAASKYQAEVEPLLKQHPDVWPPTKCGLAEFDWAAGMVQSRAFHLVKENWVTAARSEGTDLYLIPGIDQINHATQPQRRSTVLQLVEQPLTVRCGEPAKEITLDGYFTMKADRDIAAGEELLHTYGDLSDTQLLHMYGFVEEWGEGEANPHNVAFIPADTLVQGCAAIAAAVVPDSGAKGTRGGRKRKGRDEAEEREVEGARRRGVLERLGLLPPNMVVVSMEKPLTDELLTVAQVMLMPKEDFEEYAEEFKARGEEPSTSSAPNGVTAGEQEVQGVLGRAYLDDVNFREAVCFALLKAVQASQKRYATTLEEDEALLAEAVGPGLALPWRKKCAVRARLGEKRVLQRLKQQVMELLAGAESDGEEDDEDSGSDDEDVDSEGESDLSSDEESE